VIPDCLHAHNYTADNQAHNSSSSSSILGTMPPGHQIVNPCLTCSGPPAHTLHRLSTVTYLLEAQGSRDIRLSASRARHNCFEIQRCLALVNQSS